jgi:hypothetical protein
MHHALAHYYKHKRSLFNAFNEWYDEQMELFNWTGFHEEKAVDFYALGKAMLETYREFAQEEDKYYEVVAVEDTNTIDIGGLKYTGTIDLLVRDKRDGKLYPVDHKTYARLFPVEELACESQSRAYPLLVWKKYGELPGAFIFNILRKKIPAEPQILKNGGLSQAKNIDTTFHIYRNKIAELGLDPADYIDILDNLKYNKFNERVMVPRTRKELEIYEERLGIELYMMDAIKERNQDYKAYPSLTKQCVNDCSFRSVCDCMNTGGNVESIITADYIHRPAEYGSIV